MIQLREIKKSYIMGNQTLEILKGIDLTIDDGDFVAIMGPSGSGKSTLLNILGLLDVPTSGSYLLSNKEVANLSEDDLSEVRRNVLGFIFQQFNLLPRMNAEENVAIPLIYSEKVLFSPKAHELLSKVGLGDRSYHRPNELSGGQQQRVAIARSLINNPQIILADEPTGNLDSNSQAEIMKILNELNQQGITVIIVTHEEEISRQAKRIIKMRDGKIQSDERQSPLPLKNKASLKEKRTKPFSLIEIINHFDQGFKTLLANKIRTSLSMLGILIGVAAVVAMLALGKGAQKQIENQLSSLGSNLLILRSGAQRIGGVSQESGATTTLNTEDANYLHSLIPSIKRTAPQVNGRGQVVYQNKNWSTQILGASSSYAEMHAATPVLGHFFTDADDATRSRVAVIGATIVQELFNDQNPIGEMIKINKVSFQVIGVLPEKGASGYRNQDDMIIIPVNTAMHRLLGKVYYDSIEVEIDKPENIEEAQNNILNLMYQKHKIPISQQEEAFRIFNLADLQEALSKTSQTMSLLLAAIAAISLIVGGIGIMNIMLVSVTERTKEIGLRKAIGAKRIDILLQFLVESIVVSAVGGVLGIILGWFATIVLTYSAGWPTTVSISSILLSFFTSAIIGILFGVYPARKAARLNPIDALRWE